MKNNSTQNKILKIISVISTIIAFFGVPLISMPIIVLIIIICIYVIYILYNIIRLCILRDWRKKIGNEINQLKIDIAILDDVIKLNNSIDSDESIDLGDIIDLDEPIGLDGIIDLNDTDSEKTKEEKIYKEVRYKIRREEKKNINEDYKGIIENLKIASCAAVILCILNYEPLFIFSQRMVLFAKEGFITAGADEEPIIAGADEEPIIVGADEEPKTAGADEEPIIVGADEEPKTAGADEEPKTAGADEEPIIAGADEEPIITGVDEEPIIAGADEEPIIAGTDEKSEVATNREKDEWVKFKLEYPEGYPGITDNEIDELCNLVLYFNEDNLEEKVKSEIVVWENGCTENSSLDNAVTASGKGTQYYTNIENTFSNENEKILSSNLLDEVIDGREELMDSNPNGTLAWILANHNQTYALNYLHQTESARSVLFLYMKSIFNTQKSLEFEMSSEAKNERINYMKGRYKDISECTLLDDSIRLRALEIFVIMDENISNEVE